MRSSPLMQSACTVFPRKGLAVYAIREQQNQSERERAGALLEFDLAWLRLGNEHTKALFSAHHF